MPIKNRGNPKDNKWNAIKRIYDLLGKHKQIIIVNIENVGSHQVQQIRKTISKQGGLLLIGKNTVIRKAATLRSVPLPKVNPDHKDYARYQELEKLGKPVPELVDFIPLVKEKVGFVFTDTPVFTLKPLIEANKVAAPARAGVPSPIDYTIPAGPTGMDPSQITFFHALQISTKINKGQIEITKDVQVCQEGKKVGDSQVALLAKMNLKPFSFGMKVVGCYDDGQLLSKEIFNLNQDSIIGTFQNGVRNLTALSLATGIPNELSIQHFIADSFKNLASIGISIDYKFKQLQGAQTSSQPAKQEAKKEEKKEAKPAEKKKEEPEPEEAEEGGFGGLFE